MYDTRASLFDDPWCLRYRVGARLPADKKIMQSKQKRTSNRGLRPVVVVVVVVAARRRESVGGPTHNPARSASPSNTRTPALRLAFLPRAFLSWWRDFNAVVRYSSSRPSSSSLLPSSSSASLSPAASAAAFFACVIASAAAFAPAACAAFFSSSVGPAGSAGGRVSITPPAAVTDPRSFLLSPTSALHCSVNRRTSPFSARFSSVRPPTRDPRSSHSACFRNRERRADSRLLCFRRWRFSSRSS
mmetsp:Transcript_8819/g.33002  ORF Transcript_8819/g.33002 Transcript_8819/m.33002 type:complete len:245 (-) Transcript_8819:727-1461(-)